MSRRKLSATLDAAALDRFAACWATAWRRFANPAIGHSLAQIAQDGSVKMGRPILPLLVSNAHRLRRRLVSVAHAWLRFVEFSDLIDRQADGRRDGAAFAAVIADSQFFPTAFHNEPALKLALEISL